MVITREQQADLDPILDAAAPWGGIPVMDLVMAAYQLGRTHTAGPDQDLRWHYCLTEPCEWLAVWTGPHRHLLKEDGTVGIVVERVPHQIATRTSAADLRAGAARIERQAPAFAARLRREADQMDRPGAVSPAAALKATLIAAPRCSAAEVMAAIREAHAAHLEAGGRLWVLRCSADIAQAHRMPGMRVEVMRDWLAGRWDLLDDAGAVIVTSGGG
jgi:hypothetical protein